MSKLQTLLLAAHKNQLTTLRAKTRNVTRWSSTLYMLIRYNAIKDLLAKLNSKDIDELCLSSAENRRIGTLLYDLKDCNAVRKHYSPKLQLLVMCVVCFIQVSNDFRKLRMEYQKPRVLSTFLFSKALSLKFN